MEGHGLSQRRACRLVGIGHSTLRYQRRRANDEAMRKRLRELAAQRQTSVSMNIFSSGAPKRAI